MACCSLEGMFHSRSFFFFSASLLREKSNTIGRRLTSFKRRTFKDQISRKGFRALEHKARYVSRRILTKEHKGGRGEGVGGGAE